MCSLLRYRLNKFPTFASDIYLYFSFMSDRENMTLFYVLHVLHTKNGMIQIEIFLFSQVSVLFFTLLYKFFLIFSSTLTLKIVTVIRRKHNLSRDSRKVKFI